MIDLFAGIGGFRIAAESIGIKGVFSSEICRHARNVYMRNFGEWPAGDIKAVSATNVPDHDILTAGFPCQSFSHAGNLLGLEDERGQLFFEIVRLLRIKQPRTFLLENVKNFTAHDEGRTISRCLSELTEAGYTIFWEVLDSANHGVPQHRERTFLVGYRSDLRIKAFGFPKPLKKQVQLRSILESGDLTKRLVVKKPFEMRDFEDSLANAKKRNLSTLRIGDFGKGSEGERLFHINGTSATIKKFGRGDHYTTESYLVDGVPRSLTPRECARAQGFPENFFMPYSGRVANGLYGNSISVPVVRAILIEMVKQLEGEDKK